MNMPPLNGYSLMREWFEFVLGNPEKVTGNHTALYAWFVEINNRIQWREKFQITVSESMAGMACKSIKTYYKCFNDLVSWGFVEVVTQAKNQYQCNVISLGKKCRGTDRGRGNIHKHIKHIKHINIPFSVFWDSYGKKIDSVKCETQWDKLTDADRDAVMAYLPNYIKSTPDKQFRRNPLTFLNRRTWENELPATATTPDKPDLSKHSTQALNKALQDGLLEQSDYDNEIAKRTARLGA